MLSKYATVKVDPHKLIGSNEAQVFLNYKIQFGKHVGKTLHHLMDKEPSYVNWLLSEPPSANSKFCDAQNMLKALKLWKSADPSSYQPILKPVGKKVGIPYPQSKASASMLDDAMIFIWMSSTKLTAADFTEEYQEQYKVLLNDFMQADTDTFLVVKNTPLGFEIETYYTKEVLLHGGGKWNV